MAGKEIEVIEISPSSSSEKGGFGSPFSEDGSTPLRPIFCLKKNIDMESFDESEDCFILDFDPFETLDLSQLSVSKDDDHDDCGGDGDRDIAVVAEKGKVACRDYPHSRHLCMKFPFKDSPHESYCKLCFCYVCDSAAPCKFWTESPLGHCHASEDTLEWKLKRKLRKQVQM